jgi:MFS family permease
MTDKSTGAAALPKSRIALLGILTIVAYGTWFYGFGVLIDEIDAELPGGLFPLTAGYATAQILTGILGVVAGRLLDKKGARVPFALGAATGPVLFLGASYATNPWVFSVLFGAGGGIVGATAFYHLTQTVAARLAVGSEIRAIARLTIWGAFASPVLIPVTEILRATVGWRMTLRIGAVAVGAILVLAAVKVDPQVITRAGAPSPSPLAAVRAAVVVPRIRRLALSSLASSLGASVLVVLQVPVMVAGGLDRSTAAGLAGARGLAQLLGRLPLTFVLRHVSPRTALRGAKVTIGIGALLLAAATNLPIAIGFVVVAGLGIGAVSPLEGIYAREVLPAEDLGTLMGALHLLLGVAAGLGPLLAGVIVDLSGLVWTGLILAAAGAFIGAAVLRPDVTGGDGSDRP